LPGPSRRRPKIVGCDAHKLERAAAEISKGVRWHAADVGRRSDIEQGVTTRGVNFEVTILEGPAPPTFPRFRRGGAG